MADTTNITIATSISSTTKPKRSKPCESCRTHRRKCILLNANLCERCQRLAIPCYFKFAAKPLLPLKKKKSSSPSAIPSAKKTHMIQQVAQLEQWADALSTELQDLSTTSTTTMALQQQHAQKKTASWQVCIQRLHAQHLVMDTNISSISDLLAWMQQQQQTPAWPLPASNSNTKTPSLVVTLGVMPVEKALRDMFISSQQQDQQRLVIHPSSQQHLTIIKRQLIDIYFTCSHLHNPLLVAPYYHPYMHQHMNDMISWVAAAYAAYSYRSCHHVQTLALDPSTLTEIGEICRLQAKHLLDQAMFLDDDDDDDDDNDDKDHQHQQSGKVSWIFTAYLLTHLALMTLRTKEARMYADACWRMAIEQKETHVPTLTTISTTTTDDDRHHLTLLDMKTVDAESWRRLYMAARFLDIGLNLVHDHVINVAQLASHAINIGFPQPLLPLESEHTDAIIGYAQLCQLYHVAFMGNGERVSDLAFRLYMGKLTSIRSHDVAAMESRFIAFWYSLPPSDRAALAPLDYISDDRFQHLLEDPVCLRSLRVNVTYYLSIMSTALRIMPDPAQIDLTGASPNTSYDGQGGGARAVVVVSICCDAIIKMYQVLYVHLPCTVELHWLSIVLDTVLLLIHAKHPQIRQRAQQGARNAKALFRQLLCVHGVAPSPHPSTSSTHDSPTSTWTTSSHASSTGSALMRSPSPPSSSSTTSTSTSTTSTTSAHTYRVLLAQQMDAHLASKDEDAFYL